MTTFRFLPTAALAALALLATTASHAQGLGGLLNQVKTKARQAADRAATQAASDVLTGSPRQSPAEKQPNERPAANQPEERSAADQPEERPADDQPQTSPADKRQAKQQAAPDEVRQEPLSGPPSELTPENQVAYIRTQMADNRPVVENKFDTSPSYNYRRLRQLAKISVPFTWDEAAVRVATVKEKLLWDYINALSYELVSGLARENGPYLKSALQRVKEIHLTQKRDYTKFTAVWYAFDANTGVLMATLNMTEEDIGPSSEGDVGDWIVHNMTKAPKSRIELENEARFRYAREHPSSISTAPPSGGSSNGGSSAKSWTCTWCHQSVTAASRPSLSGCPRNSARQHAWHN